MRLIGRHDEDHPIPKLIGLAGNAHFQLSLQPMDQRVERRSMFAEFLGGVEGEKRHIASGRTGDLTAGNRPLLIASQFLQEKA